MLEQMLLSTNNAGVLSDTQPYRYRYRRTRSTQRGLLITCVLKTNPSKSSIRRLKLYKTAELVNAAKNVQKTSSRRRSRKGEKKEKVKKKRGEEKKKTKEKQKKKKNKSTAKKRKVGNKKEKKRQKGWEVSSCLF